MSGLSPEFCEKLSYVTLSTLPVLFSIGCCSLRAQRSGEHEAGQVINSAKLVVPLCCHDLTATYGISQRP